MMVRSPLTVLGLSVSVVANVWAQTDSLPEALQPGTPAFEELRSRIDGRERIRVTTSWGRVELYTPQMVAEGMVFHRAVFDERSRRGAEGFRRPLPYSEISRIEVRSGSTLSGFLVGAVGGLLISVGSYYLCGDSCDVESGSRVAITLTITSATALVGAAMGRDGWGWSPLYP